MLAKKHEFERQIILAVCDKEHLGKTYEDDKVFFEVRERFYNGREVTPKELEQLLDECSSANLFGNKCVEIAEKKGFVSEKSTKVVKGIKHAQIYKI